MLQIHCPHCGKTYDLTDEQVPQYAGQTIKCTACGKPFTVPGQGAAPLPPLAAQPVNYATPMQGPQQSNGLAIASIVCGVIGIIVPLVPGLLAIVFGILGLQKTRDPRVGGKGLAIAGISVGAVSILLSGCLISILVPSLNRARETANRIKCASNMRQVGQALLLYGNEYGGKYPPRLEDLILTQDITSHEFVCPSSNDTAAPGAGSLSATSLSAGGHLSYIYMPGFGTNASADTVLLYEPPTNHNGDGMNVLYGDGHVEFDNKSMAARIISELQAGHNPPDMKGY